MLKRLPFPRTSRALLALSVVVAGLAFVRAASSEPQDPIAGMWTLSGANASGTYGGTAKVEKNRDGRYLLKLSFAFANGRKGTAAFVGAFDGRTLTGERGKARGFTTIFGASPVAGGVAATYTLSADGEKLEGTYGSARESLARGTPSLLVDANRDGTLDAKDREAMKTKAALVTLVPLRKDAVRSPLVVDSAVDLTLAVTGAGAVRIVDAQGKDALGALRAGKSELWIVGEKEGDVEIVARDASGAVLDRARASVVRERLYLLMMAYQGLQIDYLAGDTEKVKRKLLPTLVQAGYAVVEDGSSYDQSVIAKRLQDPNAPKKVIVDWCTTHDDWQTYLERGSARGVVWNSHGYMEPFPGCPDEDLLKFESRVWSSAPGSPGSNERKHFVREWKELAGKQVGPLDFAVMHACCTGGLGDDAPKAWDYTDATTKSRVQAKFGSLPDASRLDTSRSFNLLRGIFAFVQTYDGSSFFGMNDVSFDRVVASIAPDR